MDVSDKAIRKYLERHRIEDLIQVAPSSQLGMVVVIPAYLEKESLPKCLESLNAAYDISSDVEILVVFNSPEEASSSILSEQKATLKHVKQWAATIKSPGIQVLAVEVNNIKARDFGAGMARKIGMDQALYRFASIGNIHGVIVSLDADCEVADNYFTALDDFFKNGGNKSCTIYYEHPLSGNLSVENYAAIVQYELHLRYYKQALLSVGFPHAIDTIGSCFALRAQSYAQAGGMPRKQAGEDFYLLHKVLPLGGFSELKATCVYPSSRMSSRVPFGTGPAVQQIMNRQDEYLSYNLQAFLDLIPLFNQVDKFFAADEERYSDVISQLPGRLASFLKQDSFGNDILHICKNCASLAVFRKRFYEVFNAFKIVKYLNFVHTHFIEKIPVYEAAIAWLESQDYATDDLFDVKDVLLVFRRIDRGNMVHQ
jgi:glycosyltransferase involved in cell wall biosynthesis